MTRNNSRKGSFQLIPMKISFFLIVFVFYGVFDVLCTEERIVTDINDVFYGVPVDFSYNQSEFISQGNSGGLISVPGCPKSENGYPWVYYGSPWRCYLAGQTGPCAPQQKIFVELGSRCGFCNCNCFEGVQRSKFKSDRDYFCTSENREYAFVSQLKKCFELYEQGPCKDGEWLAKKNEFCTRCEQRKCPEGQFPTFTSVNGNNELTCDTPVDVFFGAAALLPNQKCTDSKTTYSNLLKKCIKKFNFQF